MVIVELVFPSGKWHATPWGRQVNEGAIEWPPAPWRLLRALLAVWHHKFPDVPEAEMRRLIEALTPLPVFHLPQSSEGHTRHYMPAENDKRTKVFDTFATVDRSRPVLVAWRDVDLDDASRELLRRLLTAMTYLGRAESWVDARLVDDADVDFTARPLDGEVVAEGQELVRVLAPMSPENYADWRPRTLDELQQRKLAEKRQKAIDKGKPPEKVKLTSTDQKRIAAAVPESLFDALHGETGDIRSAGWNRPPGSRWVDYVRPRQQSLHPQGRLRRQRQPRPTVARYAIAGAVRPRLTDAVMYGEFARLHMMGCSKRENGDTASFVFSGKQQNGTPERSDERAHSHAHYLCESAGFRTHGQVTHLTIFAPQGFSQDDEAALGRLRRLKGDGHELQLVLLGMGHAEDFGGIDLKKGQSPILARAAHWVSRTPFVPTDHLRIRNREKRDPELRADAERRELHRIVRKELSRRHWFRQWADAVEIEQVPATSLGGNETRWLEFRRQRVRGDGVCSTVAGFGFKITFPQLVRGPIVLGYGCHFGLGQFIPAESAEW